MSTGIGQVISEGPFNSGMSRSNGSANPIRERAAKITSFALKTILIGALATGVIAGSVAASAGGPLATFGACAGLSFAAGLITHQVIKHTKNQFGEDCPLLSAARKAFAYSTIISVGGAFGALCAGGAVGASSALTGGIVGALVMGAGIAWASQQSQH